MLILEPDSLRNRFTTFTRRFAGGLRFATCPAATEVCSSSVPELGNCAGRAPRNRQSEIQQLQTSGRLFTEGLAHIPPATPAPLQS